MTNEFTIIYHYKYFVNQLHFSRGTKGTTTEQKQKGWEEIAIAINDKMRGLRRGKYKISIV